MKGGLTDGCREEGKSHNGRQLGEHHLAAQFLVKSSGQLNLDTANRVGSVPLALRGSGLVEVGPSKLTEGGHAVNIGKSTISYFLSAFTPRH